MHQKQKGRTFSAFCEAFALTLIVLLVWAGLMLADYRSRRVRDGARAAQEFSAVWQIGGIDTDAAQSLWHALPARARVIGGIWAAEYETAERE